jgi:hypothetical protein
MYVLPEGAIGYAYSFSRNKQRSVYHSMKMFAPSFRRSLLMMASKVDFIPVTACVRSST